MAQWWSGTEVLLYMDDEDQKLVGKEHVLVVMNHKYDIDWLMAWILAERFGMLGVGTARRLSCYGLVQANPSNCMVRTILAAHVNKKYTKKEKKKKRDVESKI